MINLADGLDTEIAVGSVLGAVALTLWALAVLYVQQRGRRKAPILRHCRRVIRERGIGKFSPTVTITPDEGHAVIEWAEEEQKRAILLTWHHALDDEHSTDHDEETDQ